MTLIPYIFSQFFDNNGDPLANGKIYFYATGGTTPLNTYADQGGESANSNPINLDSAGRSGPIFLGPEAYDIALKDSLGNEIATLTQVNANGGGGSLAAVNTLVALRALPAGSFDYVLMGGGTVQGDGAGHFYYWAADSAATDDGVNVIEPDSLPDVGRWLLLNLNNDATGSFLATLTGCSGTNTGTVYYVRKGNLVTLIVPKITGTSNTTACALTGVPAALRPGTRLQQVPIPVVRDNGNYYSGAAIPQTNGSISILFKPDATSNFTATFTGSGVKGVGDDSFAGNFPISYVLGLDV